MQFPTVKLINNEVTSIPLEARQKEGRYRRL